MGGYRSYQTVVPLPALRLTSDEPRFAVNDQDPRQVLARRLRDLREVHFPSRKVKQAELAEALSGDGRRSVSVPSISSWESATNPKVPPETRIEDIATFFASPRSLDGRASHLLNLDEMTVQERAIREKLLGELKQLRSEALEGISPGRLTATTPDAAQEIAWSLEAGPYRFSDGHPITIVCAQLPQDMLQTMPYADPSDPDFIELYRYSDLDALLELFGHLRAANPTSQVEFRAADQLSSDDYTGHLISLGGVDWNEATSSLLDRLQLPVKQVNEWNKAGGTYFEITQDGGGKVAHRPLLDESESEKILQEDVALFARAVNPYNRKRFVTVCNGMYGRGTYGAVRALTDQKFRDRNMGYIQARLATSEAFCILTRVAVANGVTLTPDWTVPETVLFEWSRPQ
jgi:hypothetical protein